MAARPAELISVPKVETREHLITKTTKQGKYMNSRISVLFCRRCTSVIAVLLAAGQMWAQLPHGAQEALDKGAIAFNQSHDYLLAVKFFQDARKLAPDDPDIYFKLGVAESKIPGRELRAICWLEAYLAATPNAPNEAKVKSQINSLDVQALSNTRRLIQSVQDTADAIENENLRTHSLENVVPLWFMVGDRAAAMKIIDRMPDWGKVSEVGDIIWAQASEGDISGAREAANRLEGYPRDNAEHAIMKAQLKKGDLAGAKRTLSLIQGEPSRTRAQRDLLDGQRFIADSQAETRDMNSAKKRFWLSRLDDSLVYSHCALNTETFLDLAGVIDRYRRGIPPSSDPYVLFMRYQTVAFRVALAQNVIDGTMRDKQLLGSYDWFR